MSGITPILDTLLHQVLGRRVDLPLKQALNEPVRPLHPADALPALRSDSRLDPRPPLTDMKHAPAQGAPASAQGTPAPGAPSARTHFSVAAKAIADVLSRFPAPPSAIRPATPLLNVPPEQGVPVTLLAQQLRASIEHSGLFYQSHLARWHRGELPLAALAREPQMQLTRPVLAQRLLQGEQVAPVQRTGAPEKSLSAPSEKRTFTDFAMPVRARDSAAEVAQPATETTVKTINDALQGLVRHQLEVLATPVVHWQGDVWTGLFMSLSLGWLPLLPESQPPVDGDEQPSQRQPDEPDACRWELSLRLSHALLGPLQATLTLARQQLLITLQCERDEIAALFSAHSNALCQRLEEAGFAHVQLRLENVEQEAVRDER